MKKGWLLTAGVAAAVGALFVFAYTPMRFCGYLFFCAAALALLWGFLAKKKAQRWSRILRRSIAAVLAVGLLIFGVLEWRIITYGRTDHSRDVAAVVVLGAGVNGTVPSLSLLVRLRAALDYVQDKPDIPIVVTGSQGPGEEISEAACMAQWLTEHGVAPERIILEEQADNTAENIDFSLRLLAERGIDTTDNIAVVTADYHLYRASIYWGTPSMVPVAAPMPGKFWPLSVNYYIREAFAAAKLLVFG